MSEIINPERWDDLQSALKLAVQGELKKLWTMMPVIVQKASDGHTTQIQATINGIQSTVDGQTVNQPIPLHLDAPVHFAGGGGVSATHPVQPGDEGLVVYAARAQDAWHQNGGTNNNPIDDRMFDLSDGRYIAGGRSDPRKLNPPPSTSSHQTRSDDGNHVADVHPRNGLTHASTKKVLASVGSGGSPSSGTLHTPGSIFKNAARVLINCVQAEGLPNPGLTLANNKQVATQPLPAAGSAGGSISSLLSSVLSGGPGAIMTNPTAAANTALSSALTSAASSISGALGGSGAALISAMTGGGGLQSVLATFQTFTSALSGASMPSGGAYGLADVLNHVANVTAFFGTTPPSSVAPATVTAPITAAPTLATMQTQVASITSQVIASTMTVSAATALINAMSTTLSGMMSATNTAIATLASAQPALSMIMGAATATLSTDPAMQAAVANLAGTNFATIAAGLQALVEATTADLAAMASFPDSGATQPGATGGL